MHLFLVYGDLLAQDGTTNGTFMVIHKAKTSAIVQNEKKLYNLSHKYDHIRKFTFRKADDEGPNRYYNVSSLTGAQIGLLITTYPKIRLDVLAAFCDLVGYNGPLPNEGESLRDWEKNKILKLRSSSTLFKKPGVTTTLLSLEEHTVYHHRTKTSTSNADNEAHSSGPRSHRQRRKTSNSNTDNEVHSSRP